MSNQSEQKIDPLTLNQTGLYVSAFALAISGAIFMAYRPMAIIEFFFLFQMGVRYIAYYRIRTESRFIEHFWTAPMKLIVAAVMMTGIPNDNVWGMVWIGVALLFAASGARNLYKVMRIIKTNQGSVSPFARTVTANQRRKESKVEDALVADLAEFLNRPDSDGTGK
jgi:hypothetical protein